MPNENGFNYVITLYNVCHIPVCEMFHFDVNDTVLFCSAYMQRIETSKAKHTYTRNMILNVRLV